MIRLNIDVRALFFFIEKIIPICLCLCSAQCVTWSCQVVFCLELLWKLSIITSLQATVIPDDYDCDSNSYLWLSTLWLCSVYTMVLLTRRREEGEADSIVAQVLTDCQGGNLSNNNCKAEGRWYIKEIEGGKVKEEAGGSPLSLHLQILTPWYPSAWFPSCFHYISTGKLYI